MSTSRTVLVTVKVISFEASTMKVLIAGFFIRRNFFAKGISYGGSRETNSVPFGIKCFKVSIAGAVIGFLIQFQLNDFREEENFEWQHFCGEKN